MRPALRAAAQPTGSSAVEWHELYARLATARPSRPIRFRGVFTDGGCDERLLQYWVRGSGYSSPLFYMKAATCRCQQGNMTMNRVHPVLAGAAV